MQPSKKRLKKELKLFDVYAIAMGTTISGGFFLLPGLAYAEVGPALIASYLLAALLVVPAMFAMVELSTAMPRAGGAYYFLDRSMGPLVGTVGGLGTYLVLILKSAFALIGMGAYLALFFPTLPIVPVAAGLAVVFGLLNLGGAKKTGAFQVVLVIGLLFILAWFMGLGVFQVQMSYFAGFWDPGFASIFGTAGLVYISYAGLTKITSVAEEVADPERNLPLGMFLALGTAVLLYGVGTWVMVGVIEPDVLRGDLTPVASAAERLAGPWGARLVTVAAVFAFFAAANAGILSASRYPMAMSRDRLLPRRLRHLNRRGIPTLAIYLTVALTLFAIVALDAMKIAKLASAFQLLMFSLLCLAVIVMRESRLAAYDPSYRSPWYPWMQIAGVVAPFFVIARMGSLSILFSLALLAVCVAWYFFYARHRVRREGAIYHIFARLGKQRYDGLDRELRGILKEKGLREEDPFDEIVMRSHAIDLVGEVAYDDMVHRVSQHLADRLQLDAEDIAERFTAGTRMGATPVTGGVALPHIRVAGLEHPELVLVRAASGVGVQSGVAMMEGEAEQVDDHDVGAFFFLVSPEGKPGQHLRILAQIAGRMDEPSFLDDWFAARDEHALKEVLLHDDQFLALRLTPGTPAADLIGCTIGEVAWPEGSLVALVHRRGETLFPHGRTRFEAEDRLTIIGRPEGIQALHDRYMAPPVLSFD